MIERNHPLSFGGGFEPAAPSSLVPHSSTLVIVESVDDALYYAPTPNTGFVSAADLTPQHAQKFMPLIFYTLPALVQEFLPHMLEQGWPGV